MAATLKPEHFQMYRESVKEFMEMLGWSPTRVEQSMHSIDNRAIRIAASVSVGVSIDSRKKNGENKTAAYIEAVGIKKGFLKPQL